MQAQPAARKSMRVQPARFQARLPHPRGARFLWAVIHSIISGGFYGKSVRFVWAVTCMRTAPRPPYWRGAAWVQAQPAARIACRLSLRRHTTAGDSYGESDTSYNERRLLWGAVRFVQAVSCVRRIPRRRRGRACRLSLRRGRACGFNPPAFKRAYRIRGARGSYGR